MSISHLEDLEVEEFISAVRRLSKSAATEKLDGLNQYFGVDEDGRIFASYEGKRSNSQRFYDESEYAAYGANNVFRSALAAVLQQSDIFLDVVKPGQTVIAEIVFGRQPNAVSYGAGNKHYIAFLSGADDTPKSVADELVSRLAGKTSKVNVEMVDTDDGENLKSAKVDAVYEFIGPQKIDSKKLADVNVEPLLAKLEKFLKQKSGVLELSNIELLKTSLTSVPKEARENAKKVRERVKSSIELDFKLPVKKELLDKVVSKLKSPLAADDLSHDEDNGIEGIVIDDEEEGRQFKIVDREGFKTIADFNRAVRAKVNGVVKSTDEAASLESRGGILGVLKIRMANLLGNIDLAKGASAKKIFASLDGEHDEKLSKLASMLNGHKDPLAMIQKVKAVIVQTKKELSELRDDFKKNHKTYKLKLASGKEIGLSDEAVKRTLMVFAETERELNSKLKTISDAKKMEDVLNVFYGHLMKSAVAEEVIADGELLLEKRFSTHEDLLKGQSAFNLMNIYLGTLFMTAILYRQNDKIGIRLIKDQKHQAIKSFSYDARPHNFWGYVIWRCNTPDVKKKIGAAVSAEMHRVLKELPKIWWVQLHRDFSSGGNLEIDWQAHHHLISQILEKFPGLYSTRVNRLFQESWAFNDLSRDAKIKLLSKLYYYIKQFVPTSPLLTRIRAIHRDLLLNPVEPVPVDQVDVEVKPIDNSLLGQVIALAEEEAATSAGAVASVDGGIGISSSKVHRFGNSKMMRRNVERVRELKFKFNRPKAGNK